MGLKKKKKQNAAALTAMPADEPQAVTGELNAALEVADDQTPTDQAPADQTPNDPATDSLSPEITWVPQAKTKKEIKQERKEEEKRKEQVRQEAKRHSVKRIRAEKLGTAILSIMVIICMVASSMLVISTYRKLNAAPEVAGTETPTTSQSNAAAPAQNAAPANPGTDAAPAAPGANVDQNAIDTYKKAHAQALSSAKVIKRTYNNTTNYNEVLEIGSSSVIAGIAKNLMGTFMKEDTSVVEYTGADIAANLPPAKSNTEGLTADMLSEATMTDDGDHYTIKLTINSTEENYDLGEKTNNLCSVMDEEEVKSAASMVTLNGMEVHYIAPTLTATVDKATGNLTHVETDVPAYLCFAEAKVAIISVKDCRIGLEFWMKYDVEY